MSANSANDDSNLSADDALHERSDIFRGSDNALPQDYETPAAPAPDSGMTLPPDHPQRDYEPDQQQAYDEGEVSATGADAQSGTNTDKNDVERDNF